MSSINFDGLTNSFLGSGPP